MALAAVVLFSVFVALGTWQVQRRTWKLDLIARVQERVHALPVPAPPLPEWPRVTAANSEYRHVGVSGTFLNDSETLVQALTELGSGFWVLTPLRQADGSVVLVNRGFVPPERRARAAHGAGEATTDATLTGLLRISEPGGSFLRRNDPAQDRWYSRDVQAIAAARGLRRVAPYFIDADATVAPRGDAGAGDAASGASVGAGTRDPGAGGVTRAAVAPGGDTGAAASAPSSTAPPVGGLTVVTFRNAHLSYAITWYALALLVVVAAWIVIREERRHA
jgi:surfeit locus 1 family protein